MIPTIAQINNLARWHLGDTEISGGQWAKDAYLQQFLTSAYQSLYRWLQRNRAELLRRTAFYNLPADTAYLTPASANLPNFGSPEDIYDRPVTSTFSATVATLNAAVPSAGTNASVDLTVTAHGLSAGSQVVTFGFSGSITDDVNDQWYIGVPDANTVRLLGCAATGTTGAVGVLSVGSGQWPNSPVRRLYDLQGQWPDSAAAQNLTSWMWNNNVFRFLPSTSVRQLKIIYDLSGNPPSSGSVGMDDSLDALAMATAALAAKSKGFPNKAADLSVRAVGNPYLDFTNATGGYFAELAQLSAQEFQMVQTVVPRYRQKRNVGPGLPW